MTIYVVKRGDTLWRIANLYQVSINDIIAVNQLENPDVLVVGQAIIIPEEDDYHIVRPGETLWSIAQRYRVPLMDLIRVNRIVNPNLIYPGMLLYIPKPTIEVNGYLTRTGEIGENILRELGEYLTYVSLFDYRIQEDGSVIQLQDEALINMARDMNVAPLMTLTNFSEGGFSSELAHVLLSNPQAQEILLTNVIRIMDEKGFIGLNIDFEYVYPEDRELYNQFLRRTVTRLHQRGFLVSTALAPKISATQSGLLYEAHDYPVHGQLADFVVLMTYEWGWSRGRPWAIAPINEVKRVLDYAVTVIPPSKILMGMPLYGRDWRLPYVQGVTVARTVSSNEALALAARFGAQIQYHELYQSPFFRYFDDQGNEHEVWFEDARSYQAKYDVVKQYGLRGVSYWELNLESPQNWPVLVSNFNMRKFQGL